MARVGFGGVEFGIPRVAGASEELRGADERTHVEDDGLKAYAVEAGFAAGAIEEGEGEQERADHLEPEGEGEEQMGRAGEAYVEAVGVVPPVIEDGVVEDAEAAPAGDEDTEGSAQAPDAHGVALELEVMAPGGCDDEVAAEDGGEEARGVEDDVGGVPEAVAADGAMPGDIEVQAEDGAGDGGGGGPDEPGHAEPEGALAGARGRFGCGGDAAEGQGCHAISLEHAMTAERDDPGGFRHVPALDGVRGMAVMLTVGSHLWLTSEHRGSALLTVLTSVRISMWLGVDVFLALSGFLITGILFDTVSSPRYLRTFYARRVLRIFPVYYLAIAVLALLAATMHFSFAGYYWRLALFAENTALWIGRPVPGALEALAGHLWSIALEEQFYLVWPLLILVVRDRRRLMGLAAGLSVAALGLRVALVLAHANVEYTYKTLPCRMDGLLMGGLLALALRGPGREKVLGAAKYAFVSAAAVLLVFAVREHGLDWRSSRFVNTAGYSVAAVAATALIGMVLRVGSAAERMFALHPLRSLGRYSYGIYVWHMVLGGLVIPPVRALAAGIGWGKGMQFVGGAVAGTGLSVLIGVLSYHAVEVHFLRLKRFVRYRPANGGVR